MYRLLGPVAAVLFTGLLAACGGGEVVPTAFLKTPTPTLALAISGTTRLITATNQGPEPAMGLQVSATGLPAGSVLRSACPVVLHPGESCLLLVTPGDLPSAEPGSAPAPARVTVSGLNTDVLTVAVAVLTHGNLYQGGYVFALDDRTTITGSVGGKVLDTLEVGNAHWGPSATAVAGVNDNSTAGPDSCNGAVDGRCNTQRILAQFPTGSRNFAAALCADSRHSGFADWYLPALCEMGYDGASIINGVCGTAAAPRLPDNARSRLFDQGAIGGFELAYWSSTQSSVNPATHAHIALPGLDSTGSAFEKQVAMPPARCARFLTP